MKYSHCEIQVSRQIRQIPYQCGDHTRRNTVLEEAYIRQVQMT